MYRKMHYFDHCYLVSSVRISNNHRPIQDDKITQYLTIMESLNFKVYAADQTGY